MSIDPITDVLNTAWLEQPIVGKIRIWHLIFFCIAGMTTLIVMVCCCFRFRIPRTKQQIEADYQRRMITCKFRQRLETIQDAKMDAMSLKDALDLLHETSSEQMESPPNNPESQHSSIVSPQQSSLDAPFQPGGGQKPEPQASMSNPSFVKFASKVATLTKLGAPKSPTSPTASGNNMDF